MASSREEPIADGLVQEVRHALDPVKRYLNDAFAVAKTAGLPAQAAKRVIPGLCRLGVEAACMEAVRKRRLGKGENYAAVENLLADEGHWRAVELIAAELMRLGTISGRAARHLFEQACDEG